MTWIPFIVFMLVTGLVLMAGSIWHDRYSPEAKAKTQRLQDIRTYLEGDAAGAHGQQAHGLTALEGWLRAHVGAYRQLEILMTRADSRHSPMRVLGLSLSLFSFTFLSFLVGHVSALAALPCALAIASLPFFQLGRAAAKRRTQFEEKLPEALDYLTRALRAGHSITVAIGMAANELADPIGTEFRKVFEEIGFGIPFDESMNAMAGRVNSPDLSFLVIALPIQRETGGNLTELLDGLAKTIRERIKFKGKIKTLSSEGRFSAVLLGSLPFVLGAILSLLNPAYMRPLWETPQGQNLLIIGAVLLVVGFVALTRITNIKV